jgi:hypothetical protein
MREMPDVPFSQRSPFCARTMPETPSNAMPDASWTPAKRAPSKRATPSSPPIHTSPPRASIDSTVPTFTPSAASNICTWPPLTRAIALSR